MTELLCVKNQFLFDAVFLAIGKLHSFHADVFGGSRNIHGRGFFFGTKQRFFYADIEIIAFNPRTILGVPSIFILISSVKRSVSAGFGIVGRPFNSVTTRVPFITNFAGFMEEFVLVGFDLQNEQK